MKKLISLLTCVALSLCVLFSFGCSDEEVGYEVFNGDYQAITANELLEFKKDISALELGFNFNKSVKFEFKENEIDGSDYEKETVSFVTNYIEGSFKMSGLISEEEHDDGRKQGQTSEIYYDNQTLYVHNTLRKECYQTSLESYFERATIRLLDYSIDKVITRYSNLEETKLFKEENADITKIKVEFEDVKQGDEKVSGKILFTYNTQKELIALNVNIKEQDIELFSSREYDQIVINIEKTEETVELPTDLDTYQLVTLKAPW